MKHFSDRITCIRNGQKACRPTVIWNLPKGTHFKKLHPILELLQKEGVIRGFSFSSAARGNVLNTVNSRGENLKPVKQQTKLAVHLKYDSTGKGVIRTIYAASKPGRCTHISSRSLWQPQASTGFYVLSTTCGILTDAEARLQNVGGKILLEIT